MVCEGFGAIGKRTTFNIQDGWYSSLTFPMAPTVGDVLTCVPGGYHDDDFDDDNTRLEWFIGTESVGTGTEFTGSAEEGDSIRCEATANDGLEDGTSLDVTVTIGA
jgi:hypothetical protein